MSHLDLHRGWSQANFYDIDFMYGEGFFFSIKTAQTLLLLITSALEGKLH